MKDKRESFNSRWGFILACIGSAVGMGNIWMFPTRVSLYGGGSFLIPYFIFVVVDRIHWCDRRDEFGRAARSGPIDAFGMVCEKKGKRKVGEGLGMIPVLGSLAMAIGYTVVMGDLKICCWNFHRGNTCTKDDRRIWRTFWNNGICIWK